MNNCLRVAWNIPEEASVENAGKPIADGAAFGVTGALIDPFLSIFDSAGRQIAVNDNLGAVIAGSELARVPGVPTNPSESTLVLVLPPGTCTTLIAGANAAPGSLSWQPRTCERSATS